MLPRVDDLRLSGLASRRFLPTPGPHLVGQAGSGSEFFALREYQDGDTMRDVNWRASARTGRKLVVNQREVESHATVTVFMDGRRASLMGSEGDHAWAHMLRAVASVASALGKRRDRARVVLYGGAASAVHEARAGDSAQLGLLMPLCARVPDGDSGLGAAVADALPRLLRRGACLIITTLVGDEGIADAVGALRSLDLAVTVLALDAPRFLALAGEPPALVEAAREGAAVTVAALRAKGATVVAWRTDQPLALAFAAEDAG